MFTVLQRRFLVASYLSVRSLSKAGMDDDGRRDNGEEKAELALSRRAIEPIPTAPEKKR